jgi:5-hydroxyisourate hydrolase
MSGYLTTHVLDTARGCPAAGLRIELYRLSGQTQQQIAITQTNHDGPTGEYELVFHAGEYLRNTLGMAADQVFLDIIPIRFVMHEAQSHYHVPLLLSPFGYSTYRGS